MLSTNVVQLAVNSFSSRAFRSFTTRKLPEVEIRVGVLEAQRKRKLVGDRVAILAPKVARRNRLKSVTRLETVPMIGLEAFIDVGRTVQNDVGI
jgi:hypothetical protein